MSLLNWTSHLARRLRRRQDSMFDRRLGLDTCEIDLKPDTSQLPEQIRPHARHYAPTPIAMFRRLVGHSRVNPRDFGFVDLGAGKGRTLLLASRLGFDPVIGIEIDPGLCRIAVDNIRRWNAHGGVLPVVVQGDARGISFPAGNLFIFLFNPFTGPIFDEVAARLAEIAAEPGRAVIVAYHNDSCGNALETTGAFRRIRMRRLHFWRPPTVSLFFNDEAWRMGGWRRYLPRSRAAKWRTVRAPSTRQAGATTSNG